MKDKKTVPEKSTPEDTTQKSIETGKKAIKTAGETTGKASKQVQKKEEKDAEKWRNEG